MTHNHQPRTGRRIAEQIFDNRTAAERFVAACQAHVLPAPGNSNVPPLRDSDLTDQQRAVLASGRVEEIKGRFHARFDY